MSDDGHKLIESHKTIDCFYIYECTTVQINNIKCAHVDPDRGRDKTRKKKEDQFVPRLSYYHCVFSPADVALSNWNRPQNNTYLKPNDVVDVTNKKAMALSVVDPLIKIKQNWK